MNEPAFPMFKPRIENYCEEEVIPGMSLRDYFAAKAMQAICSNPDCANVKRRCTAEDGHGNTRVLDETIADSIASNAYFMADAMLKSRTEPKL
jgi:hypothetical protein